ncbi:MAG: dienelactone hydrolase family protein [Candidatus Binataceae bacterium]
MAGRTISIAAKDGGASFTGYVAVPPGGRGPGLVVLQEIFGVNQFVRDVCDLYAEEGYVALAPDLFWRIEPGVSLEYTQEGQKRARELFSKFDYDKSLDDIGATLRTLRSLPECTGKAGVVGYCLGGRLAYQAAARHPLDAAVAYYPSNVQPVIDEGKSIKCPITVHFGEKDAILPEDAREKVRAALSANEHAAVHVYAGADHGFANFRRDRHHRFSALLAHSFTMGTLRSAMGPHYDLSALWDAHTDLEFSKGDVDATMKTMIAEPYVNHIPTLTGGVGQIDLHRFYKYHFIPSLPEDTKTIPVYRTVGPDRLVDEMLFTFTHTREIDWMLPGIKPTGKYVEVPLVAVIQFRGDKICHEHIYWDQASVLKQIGVLEPDGLPMVGIESAKKLIDENAPSNELMPSWKDSAGKS